MNVFWVVEERVKAHGKRGKWSAYSPHEDRKYATLLRNHLRKEVPHCEWRVRKYVPAAKRGGR